MLKMIVFCTLVFLAGCRDQKKPEGISTQGKGISKDNDSPIVVADSSTGPIIIGKLKKASIPVIDVHHAMFHIADGDGVHVRDTDTSIVGCIAIPPNAPFKPARSFVVKLANGMQLDSADLNKVHTVLHDYPLADIVMKADNDWHLWVESSPIQLQSVNIDGSDKTFTQVTNPATITVHYCSTLPCSQAGANPCP